MDLISYINFSNFRGLSAINNNFINNLTQLISLTQITEEEMSKQVFIQQKIINNYLIGKKNLSLIDAYKLASFFLLEPEELILKNNIESYFLVRLKKYCMFSPKQNIPIAKKRFIHLDIEKLLQST